jgi:head-tail adaptor
MPVLSRNSTMAQFMDYTLSANAYGDAAQVPANVGSAVFVMIRPALGTEIQERFQQDAHRPAVITLNYRSDIAALSPKALMTWNSRTFNLVSVQNIDEANQCLLIHATENV